ncbi:MAG: hypothetical protein IPM26_00565 [Saprospiraceae bacterium]|nr:hypothetical protein [Saprospiraceae bacterium]
MKNIGYGIADAAKPCKGQRTFTRKINKTSRVVKSDVMYSHQLQQQQQQQHIISPVCSTDTGKTEDAGLTSESFF